MKSFATSKQVSVIIIGTFKVKKINKSPWDHFSINTIFTDLTNFPKISKRRKRT